MSHIKEISCNDLKWLTITGWDRKASHGTFMSQLLGVEIFHKPVPFK